ASAARAQTIRFTSVPDGYTTGSIELPREFSGALGVDPTDDNVIFASIGGFGDMDLARINLLDGSVTIVADGPFGTIGGIAVLSPSRIVIVENSGVPGSGLTTDTLLLASDLNLDGDFDDAGEISELIAPILTESGNFTGTQARVTPAGNPSGIPSGSVIFQTADGGGNAELLIVENPLTAPAFRPMNAAYFSGFDFNGGFDFDSSGRIFMGSLDGASFTGDVHALVNVNGNETIDAGESNKLVTGENGMSDLIIDAEDDIFFAGANELFAAAIRTFRAPGDPLVGTATPTDFAVTDSGFLTGVILNSKERGFEAGVAGGATMLLGGFTADFSGGINLLTLKPLPLSSARNWALYD
ncbi:hypothetical protein IIC65_09150, partial [Candidatus Sumerlaeota bacterium]|nr:hypothetical protein [Candidatus Sumerlaeota bacterium]